MLDMKPTCETCGTALAPGDPAMICSYECTFCVSCADSSGNQCPNCKGELRARPRRAPEQSA